MLEHCMCTKIDPSRVVTLTSLKLRACVRIGAMSILVRTFGIISITRRFYSVFAFCFRGTNSSNCLSLDGEPGQGHLPEIATEHPVEPSNVSI